MKTLRFSGVGVKPERASFLEHLREAAHFIKKERILIGEELQIRFRLRGNTDTDVLCDVTRPLGTFLAEFEPVSGSNRSGLLSWNICVKRLILSIKRSQAFALSLGSLASR